MAGLGKFLKEAQKMQKQLQDLQAGLADKVLEISHGGGAVTIKIDGQGSIQGILIDSEFMKEDKATVEETLLGAIQEAQAQVKAMNDSEMSKLSGNMPNFPGLGGF